MEHIIWIDKSPSSSLPGTNGRRRRKGERERRHHPATGMTCDPEEGEFDGPGSVCLGGRGGGKNEREAWLRNFRTRTASEGGRRSALASSGRDEIVRHFRPDASHPHPHPIPPPPPIVWEARGGWEGPARRRRRRRWQTERRISRRAVGGDGRENDGRGGARDPGAENANGRKRDGKTGRWSQSGKRRGGPILVRRRTSSKGG